MRYRILVATACLLAGLESRVFVSGGADLALPLKDGRPIVAMVNDEPIFLHELEVQLEGPDDIERLRSGQVTATDVDLVDRLVTLRLVVQEAARMGLGDLPQLRKQIEVASRQALRDVLMDYLVKDVQADEAAVEQQYKELVKEYRTQSLLFQDETAAKNVRAEMEKGASFADVAARAVADQRARTQTDDGYHRQKDYLPAIGDAVAGLGVGQVSPVIRIQAGYVVVTVTEIRYPESADERAQAKRMVLDRQRAAALAAKENALREQYVVVHSDVLEGLDFAAKEPGLDALQKDTRAVADIKGASPVTIGDLTEYMRMQSFHGGDPAAEGKRMNGRKRTALEAILSRRVLNHEAQRLGLEKSTEYIDRVNAFEDSMIFGAFVEKVISPDSKLKEEDVKGYYDTHVSEFSSPEMIRMRSLAFTVRESAEDAARKLRDGAEFGWLATTAEDQADKSTEGLLVFDGRPVTTDSMPDGLKKVLVGAKTGEIKLYASPEDMFYVLAIQDVISPDPRPFDEVKELIAKKLYDEKLKAGVEQYAAKLREQARVETYLKRAQ